MKYKLYIVCIKEHEFTFSSLPFPNMQKNAHAHTHTHTHARTHAHTHTHTHTHICKHSCIHMHMHIAGFAAVTIIHTVWYGDCLWWLTLIRQDMFLVATLFVHRNLTRMKILSWQRYDVIATGVKCACLVRNWTRLRFVVIDFVCVKLTSLSSLKHLVWASWFYVHNAFIFLVIVQCKKCVCIMCAHIHGDVCEFGIVTNLQQEYCLQSLFPRFHSVGLN